jgi:hypothetical protein
MKESDCDSECNRNHFSQQFFFSPREGICRWFSVSMIEGKEKPCRACEPDPMANATSSLKQRVERLFSARWPRLVEQVLT